MQLDSFSSTILGAVIGGIVTWLVAQIYYARASKELSAEANKLRQLNNLILLALEQSNLATLSRDSKGDITGIVGHISGSSKIKFQASGNLTDANSNK
jgi:hypothetical protein